MQNFLTHSVFGKPKVRNDFGYRSKTQYLVFKVIIFGEQVIIRAGKTSNTEPAKLIFKGEEAAFADTTGFGKNQRHKILPIIETHT
jgi:hypothetical protein